MSPNSFNFSLKWDLRFLELAKHISEWSRDPSTKVGAVATYERRVLATGYNGFPKGIADLPGRLLDRNEKLLRTVHAEANIVAQAAQHGVSLKNSTIYIWPFLPCSNCCTLMIQVGVRRVVVPRTPIPDRWRASFDMSVSMLDEANVVLTRLDVPEE
jgi:dCMP deaminase